MSLNKKGCGYIYQFGPLSQQCLRCASIEELCQACYEGEDNEYYYRCATKNCKPCVRRISKEIYLYKKGVR